MNISLLKCISVVFLFFCSLSSFSFWKWTKVASLGNGKRFESTSFSLNGKGYVTCGVDTNDNCYNDLWQYDPVFDVWTQKANLPASYRRAAFGFEINGKGYIGGGCDDALSSGNLLNDCWMYDPLSNTWVAKSTVPYYSYRFASTSCNGLGYIIGGASSWSPLSDVYEYNPTSDSWFYKTTFPGLTNSSGGREGAVVTTLNNKIYFGMGKDDSFFQNDWWEYDPTNNNWLRKADFPASGRIGAFGFAFNNLIVVGMGSDGGYNSDAWWFDATANTWNYTCSFSGGGRRSAASFAIGSVGYMGTGKSANGSKQDFYKLDASVGINELTNENNLFSVYPNPITNGIIHITMQSPLVNASVNIVNLAGQLIHQEKISELTQNIIPSYLPAGNYFVSIANAHQLIATKKIIVL